MQLRSIEALRVVFKQNLGMQDTFDEHTVRGPNANDVLVVHPQGCENGGACRPQVRQRGLAIRSDPYQSLVYRK
jgi:hypothetical protein